MSITKRCLTLNEVNYNFSNDLAWSLNISTREISGKELVERDEESEESEELEQNSAASKQIIHYKVHSVRNVSWS